MIVAPPVARHVWPLRRSDNDPLIFLNELAATGLDVVPFRLGRRPAFLLNHPATIEEVLVRQAVLFEKGRGYERAARLLGNGLLTAAGPLHRERRRAAQGAFHRQRVEAQAPIIVERAVRCRDAWQVGRPVDVAREMRALTLGIAGDALFGTDLVASTDAVADALASALAPMDGLLAIVAPPARTRRARRALDAVVDAIIAARSATAPGGDDLLAMLLAARTDDSPDAMRQLRDDVLTFVLASHDTLSHALTWTWLLLAAHTDVEAALGAELAAVLGSRTPAADDVPRLPYARAVVAETLRLFPPAWVIVRRASAAAQLAGVDIPSGSVVVASPFVTHRDARYFREPLQFRPERWLSEDAAAARPRLAYFPFGAGPRVCIGEGFAWLEATLVLGTLAQRWRLARSTSAPVVPLARVTLRPANEPPMTPHLR